MSESDPTQTGGRNEARLSVEEEIAARHMEATKDDYVDFPAEVTAAEEPPEAPEPAPEPAEAAPEPEVAPEPVAAPAPAPKMASIVVDGQTIEVEESRLLEAGKRTLQKETAADRKLQDAARLKREAEEYAQRVGFKGQEAPPQSALSQDAPQQPATFSPEALDAVLENKLYNRDAQKAAAKFREDFPEIAADPHLMNMAANLESQRLATVTALGESYGDPFEAYHKHGDAIRQWLGKYKPAEVSEDKVERKRTITAVPAANAKAPAPQQPREMTVSEVIAQERKAREGRPAPK